MRDLDGWRQGGDESRAEAETQLGWAKLLRDLGGPQRCFSQRPCTVPAAWEEAQRCVCRCLPT